MTSGFGVDPFGESPFGHADWTRVVLWDELPEEKRNEDLEAGGYYYKFVTSILPAFDELRFLIYRKRELTFDPRTTRKDLLEFLAKSFGIVPDLAEPEAYQRTKIEIAGRWRLIKGTDEAYKVLCAIHGFQVDVQNIWWDGSEYSTSGPQIDGEIIGEFDSGEFSGRITCWPIEPGNVTIVVNDGTISRTLTDDGDGNLVGDGTGTIDYSYGWFSFDLDDPEPASGTDVVAIYVPVEGGCAADCGACATHYVKLDITPGTITGSDEFTMSDAWQRLFVKLERDVKPIYVEFYYESIAESFIVNIGYHFDIIPGDEETLDTGLRAVFDDTSW